MKLLVSMNYKFMELTPKDFFELIIDKKNIDGFEIFINNENDNEVKYLRDFAYIVSKKNYILQMHGDINNEKEKNYKYLDLINEISNITNQRINIVYHSLYDEDRELSINKTIDIFGDILNYISLNNYNISISIENLNDINGMDRLDKNDILSVLNDFSNLYFTYDIGHEIVDYGTTTNLTKLHVERLNNVHIHSFINSNDHQELINDEHKQMWIKALTYLKFIDYNNTIVLEYDLYSMYGNNIKEKIYSYIDSLDRINEYFYN